MDNQQGLNYSEDQNQFSDEDDDDDRGGFSNIGLDELLSDLKESPKIVNKKMSSWDDDYEEDEEEEEDDDKRMGYGQTGSPKHEPQDTPLPADNLKSAMKSRDKKDERADKQRNVTWAADVYDPPPTSESHYASNRTERHKNETKKSGKNRQKGGGKGAGGGGGAKGGQEKINKQGGGGRGGSAKVGKDKDKKKQVKKYGATSKYSEYDAFY